jgi:hypothetical protein
MSERKKDKGKGKLVEPIESEEEDDEEFHVSDQELYDTESDQSSSEAADEESEQEELQDEIAELFQEAEENGDKGDLVIGLRSGRTKALLKRSFHEIAPSPNQGSSKESRISTSPSKKSKSNKDEQ